MTERADETPYESFKCLVEEAFETVQYEIDQLAGMASAFDDNLSESDVENAWDCGKSCGRLEVVQELFEWLLARPADHYRWPPEGSTELARPASNWEYACALLSQALNYCTHVADGTLMRLAIRLLSGGALTGDPPKSASV